MNQTHLLKKVPHDILKDLLLKQASFQHEKSLSGGGRKISSCLCSEFFLQLNGLH